MDLHFATEKVASLKDAALRYLVIVAGILTALGLGQWVEGRQHAHQGAQALQAIEAELRRNQVVLAGVLDTQKAVLAKLEAAQAQLGKDSFAVPDLPARAQALLKGDLLNNAAGLNLAALQHSAWDTAVASQSLQYLAPDRAVALARTYAALSEVSTVSRETAVSATVFDNLSVMDAYSRGESRDALRFARAVRQQRLVVVMLNNGYTLLQTLLSASLGSTAPPATASSMSAAAGASAAGAASGP